MIWAQFDTIRSTTLLRSCFMVIIFFQIILIRGIMLVKRMYGVLLMMEPAGDCIFKVGELKISWILFTSCGL